MTLNSISHLRESWGTIEPTPFSQSIKPSNFYETTCFTDVSKMEMRSCLGQNVCPNQ